MNIVKKDIPVKFTTNTATIKLETNCGRGSFASGTTREVKALAILLGAYNRYGRSLDVDKVHEQQARFAALIDEVADDLKHAEFVALVNNS